MKKLLFVLAFMCIAFCACTSKNVETAEPATNDTVVAVDTNTVVDTLAVADTLK